MTTEQLKENSIFIDINGKSGDAKLTLYRSDKIGYWIETNGEPITENEEGFRDLLDQEFPLPSDYIDREFGPR